MNRRSFFGTFLGGLIGTVAARWLPSLKPMPFEDHSQLRFSTAYEQEHIWLDLLEKRGDVLDVSSRNIRLPQLIRPGGKFSQGTGDFDEIRAGTWEVPQGY